MQTVAARAARSGLRSPRFRRVPCARDTAFDPGRASAPRVAAVPHMLPSTKRNVSASASSRISWLNPAPHALAVYASPQPSPTDVQHSLPGRRYPFPGRDFQPLEHASFSWRTRLSGPACSPRRDRAQRRSRMAARPCRACATRAASLTVASTAPGWTRTGRVRDPRCVIPLCCNWRWA